MLFLFRLIFTPGAILILFLNRSPILPFLSYVYILRYLRHTNRYKYQDGNIFMVRDTG
nr:MAG TPA: hypothetical protein [Caudoviricetes sp.]